MLNWQEDVSKDHQDNQISDVTGVMDEDLFLSAGGSQSRVRSMASLLLAKFEENAPSPSSLTSSRRQVCVCVCVCLCVCMNVLCVWMSVCLLFDYNPMHLVGVL